MNGTRFTREECALLALSVGVKRSAYRAPAGQRTLSGMRSEAVTGGSKPRTVARAGTTGYARAYRRAFDWQPKGRLGSGVWYRARRRYAPTTQFRQWSVQRPSASMIQYEASIGQTEAALLFPERLVEALKIR